MDHASRHEEATIDGVRIHWVELGDVTGAVPLLLLHGLSDCHRTWTHVAPKLAADRRVLMPDLPGHGLSGRPDASYELHWYARVVARWLDSLRQDQVDIVAHSFGGGVAQMLLLECPERIRRLVLVASGGLGREIRALLRLASMPGVVESFGQRFMGLGTRLALRGDGCFTDIDIRELAVINAQPGSARAFARTVRDVIDWRGQRRAFFDRAREIASLPPIAVLWGSRDKVIPVDHGRAFAESLEDVAFVPFEGCGHWLHRERPEEFVRTVRELLETPSLCSARLRSNERGRQDAAPDTTSVRTVRRGRIPDVSREAHPRAGALSVRVTLRSLTRSRTLGRLLPLLPLLRDDCSSASSWDDGDRRAREPNP